MYMGVGSNPTSDKAFWLGLMRQKQMQALIVVALMEASTLIVFCAMKASYMWAWIQKHVLTELFS